MLLLLLALSLKKNEQVISYELFPLQTMKGGDHAASLEPEELKSLISGIRLIEKALGKREKIIRPSEIPCTKKVGGSGGVLSGSGGGPSGSGGVLRGYDVGLSGYGGSLIGGGCCCMN